jgi:hypothetical protein
MKKIVSDALKQMKSLDSEYSKIILELKIMEKTIDY